ncbi:hypothetical protein PAEPH01_1709 [Pancytospora epiphaga]|nr:hypothetical protein PAEPH01_1709 [Pancytospora epiphaga]
MRIICILLIFTVFGILTLDELQQNLQKPFNDNNNNVYINPDGSLNLLHGYISYGSRLIHKKRLFSPGLKINYRLTNVKNKSSFKRDNTMDKVNTFGENSGLAGQYLTEYYKAVRTMYNVVNGEVNIQTNRDQSLYRFLTQKFFKESCFKLLAVLLLLADGVDLPVKFIKKTIKFDNLGNRLEKPMNIQVLVYKMDADVEPLFEIEIYNVIRRKRKNEEDCLYMEEKRYTLKEIVSLIQFFINNGGEDIKKLDSYKLESDDTPSFLIRSYIFEFIRNVEEARLLFKVVNNILACTENKKGSKVWSKLFTEDAEKIKKYEPVYKALKTVNKSILESGFPFSSQASPPSNMIVNGYDRKLEVETTDLCFSDCCDITIYTLLCCLFYDPVNKRYSLDHLDEKGYKPSKDLKHFFSEVCQRPVGLTPYFLHQRWTHVVQDLVLSEGELMGGEVAGNNTIRYCKEANGVFAEIQTEMLNVLKVVSKVAGMPRSRIIELGEISAMVQSDNTNMKDIYKRIDKYITEILKELSIMKTEVKIDGIEWLTMNNQKGLYGNIEIKFRPTQSDDEIDVSDHIISFDLKRGHACATVVSKYNEIKGETIKTLEELVANCEGMKSSLWRMARNRVHEFLSQGKFKPVPLEMVEKVEQAQNYMERYLAINKILSIHRIETMNDKLYFIDLFAPYLDKMTKNSSGGMEEQTSKKTGSDFVCNLPRRFKGMPNKGLTIRNNELQPSDPLVRLISNILGSVPLDDKTTQFFFIQIFVSCNGKYRELFPNISGDIMIFLGFRNFNLCDSFYYSYLTQFHNCNAPNMLNRLYNRLREDSGNTFLKYIGDYNSTYYSLYILMVRKCIILNCSAGIKAVKEDFRIREGRIVSEKDDALLKFNIWLDTAITMEYYEGFEEICEIWKNLQNDNDENGRLSSTVFAEVKLEARIRWWLLLDTVENEIYKNEKYIEVLLNIGVYCTYGIDDMNILYELFEHYFTISLCKSLASTFEDIVDDLGTYLSRLEAFCIKTNTKPSLKDLECVIKCALCIDRLNFFIETVVYLLKRRNAMFKGNEEYAYINGRIMNTSKDILMLRGAAMHLRYL